MEQEKEQDLKLITTYIPRTFNYQKGTQSIEITQTNSSTNKGKAM